MRPDLHGEPVQHDAGRPGDMWPGPDAPRHIAQRAQPGAVVQCVRVADLDRTDDEIWDEVAWYLFDNWKLPAEHRDRARQIFDRLPGDKKYEYYEEIAEEIEKDLSSQVGQSFTHASNSESGGGWFGTLMKLLVGYLALSSLIPTAKAEPTSSGDGSSGPLPGNVPDSGTDPVAGTVDAMGKAIRSDPLAVNMLKHVECEPSVIDLCTSVRANGVYDGLLEAVDKVCERVTIRDPRNDVGACVFNAGPKGGKIGGAVSCTALQDYDASKIGHELQHAFDHCRVEQSGQSMTKNAWVVSEINAHATQAAIAKLDQQNGRPIDDRDAQLVKNFDDGCPLPTPETRLDNANGGMYSIIHRYHMRYVKETLDRKTLVATYQTDVKRAVARYNDMVANGKYELVNNYKRIK